MSSCTTSAWAAAITAIAIVLSSYFLWMTAAGASPQSIPLPGSGAYPESITSTPDGTLYIGRLGEGGVVRANPRTGETNLFVAPGVSGSQSITGVFADDASNTLWACSNDLSALGGPSGGGDHTSTLKGFDLESGVAKRSVPLPGAHPFCNDIAVDAGGAVYVTDSAGPSVLRLRTRASGFEVFASSPQFLPPPSGGAGLDGIAFGSDGNLYVTTYAAGGLFRIGIEGGMARDVIKLRGTQLTLPDALRALGEKTFLLVEGGGSLDLVKIDGDGFKATPIRSGFRVPTSATRVGSTVWVSEGQLSSFFDQSHRHQSPSLPFRIYAVPLRKGQIQ